MSILIRIFCCCILTLSLFKGSAQSVVIDGKMVSTDGVALEYKDYWAELRADDSVLIEKQRINTAGNFTLRLMFAHDYYVSVQNKTKVIWRLLVRNRVEEGLVHYPVTVEMPSRRKDKDVYEVTLDKKGDKVYLKNGMPISEITYQFETERRDSTEILKK
jgi:hypothetical protein